MRIFLNNAIINKIKLLLIKLLHPYIEGLLTYNGNSLPYIHGKGCIKIANIIFKFFKIED